MISEQATNRRACHHAASSSSLRSLYAASSALLSAPQKRVMCPRCGTSSGALLASAAMLSFKKRVLVKVGYVASAEKIEKSRPVKCCIARHGTQNMPQ